MPRELIYNTQLLSLFQSVKNDFRAMPLVLGGSTGSGGGTSGNPGGIVGQLAQTRVAGDTTESTVYTSGSITSLLDNLNNIRNWQLPAKNFWATQTNPVSASLDVSAGEWYYIDGAAPMVYGGGTSPAITTPSAGNRYDLLTINTSGVVSWISGEESVTPVMPPFPSATSGVLPLWAVYSRSSGSLVLNSDDSLNHYIYQDYRPFIGGPTVFASTGSAYIGYQWYSDGPLSTGSGINGLQYIPGDFSLTGSFGYVGTTPSSGSVIVDIQYSTDNGVSWASVYSSTPLVILSGDEYGVRTPNAVTLTAGTLARANITDVGGGSASSLSVVLFGSIRSASGGGTVGGVSVGSSDGIISSVVNPSTYPTISLSLGDITPDSVAALGTVTGSNLSGTNTGDQTIVLSGPVTGSGTTTIVTALSSTGVTPGHYTQVELSVGADGRLISATSGSSSVPLYPYAALDVSDTGWVGASGYASDGEHVHRAVHSMSTPGYAFAYGDISLVGGLNVTLTQSSGSITISATSGSAAVDYASIAESNAGVETAKVVNPAGLPLRVENGALVHNQPYGGNLRGANAVDLQSSRSAATQVSSGSSSAIISGINNTNSGGYSFIGAGDSNTITNETPESQSGIVAGNSNTIRGSSSFIGAGSGNLVSIGVGGGGVLSGENNEISAKNSGIPGGAGAKTSNTGQIAHASGVFAVAGDAQGTIQMVARREIDHSINIGWQDLFLDGSSNTISIPTDTAWMVDVLVTAVNAGLSGRGYYQILGAVANIAGTAQIDAQTVTTVFETTAAWDVQLAVSGATLIVQVTDGTDTETIRWVATIRTCEVSN